MTRVLAAARYSRLRALRITRVLVAATRGYARADHAGARGRKVLAALALGSRGRSWPRATRGYVRARVWLSVPGFGGGVAHLLGARHGGRLHREPRQLGLGVTLATERAKRLRARGTALQP